MGRTFSEIGTNVRDYIEVLLRLSKTIHSIPKEKYGNRCPMDLSVPDVGVIQIFNEKVFRRGDKRKHEYDIALSLGSKFDIIFLEGYDQSKEVPVYMLDRDLSSEDNLVSYYPNYDLPYEIDSTTPEEILFQYSTTMSSHELMGWYVIGEMKRMGIDIQMSVLYNERIQECTEKMWKIINAIQNTVTHDHQF